MVSAIIVAAGKGTRMGPKVDKLFLELDGCPIVAHTWRQFDEAGCIDEIVLVVREGMQAAFKELAETAPVRQEVSRWLPAAKSGRTPSGTGWQRCRRARRLWRFKTPRGPARARL